MYLNKEQFLNEVKSQELKFLCFFDKERQNYDNINGNFRVISCTKRAEFPQVIEELEKFIEDYKNNTFICKAAPYRNGRNFKVYKVNFGGTEPAHLRLCCAGYFGISETQRKDESGDSNVGELVAGETAAQNAHRPSKRRKGAHSQTRHPSADQLTQQSDALGESGIGAYPRA